MPDAPKRSRGRPPKQAAERKRNTLAIRVRDELRSSLEQAAASNQRSLSEEAEFRLEQSLAANKLAEQALDLAFGRRLTGVILLLAGLLRDVGMNSGFISTLTDPAKGNWLDDPYAFDQASQALTSVLEAMRPPGEIRPPQYGTTTTGLNLDELFESLGLGLAKSAVRSVAGYEVSGRLDAWTKPIRERLGDDILMRLNLALQAPRPDHRRPQ